MIRKIFVGILVFIILLYALFLIAPVFLSGFVNSYDFSKIIEEACGYKVKLSNIKLITTPKLTVGIKVSAVDAALPNGESFLTADNVQGKLSLLPIIVHKIELDMIGADNVNLNLKVKKDGHFLIEDYIPEADSNELNAKKTEPSASEYDSALPFGFKLSNKLPDIKINNYNISFIDMPTDNTYSLYGDNFYITDFILNKRVRVSALGGFMLQDKEQFKFDVNVLNKIMPDADLNDLVFANNSDDKPQNQNFEVNVIDIFKAIYKNQLTANLKAKMVVGGSLEDVDLSGNLNVSDFSIAVDGKPLPAGNLDLKLKGNAVSVYSKLYSSASEITELTGTFKTGKKPDININCKSNAKFASLIDIADSVSKSFGYNKLDTLNATGGIDADFSLKSDFKKVTSSGYLKIPAASLSYKLYNIAIDKIFADIQFADNNINILNSGFSILGHPLSIRGSVTNDAVADLSIIADKLQLKGLLLAAGQLALLKENQVNSGNVSFNILIKGKLNSIIPKISVYLDNLNVKNISSNTSITMQNTKADISTDGKTAQGNINVNNIKIINPAASFSVPKANIILGEKDIDINNTYAVFNNSRIDIAGKVANYMGKNMKFDINAKGNILANDIKSLVPKDFKSEVSAKGSLPLQISVSGNDKSQEILAKVNADSSNYFSVLNIEQLKGKKSQILSTIKINGDLLKFEDTGVYVGNEQIIGLKGSVTDLYKTQHLALHANTPSNLTMSIPFLKGSKLVTGGNIDILGNAFNPTLKGSVTISSITVPDMFLTMKNMDVTLNGPIVSGKGTLKSFVCGGIVADNLSSDFNLTNNVFYLKNLNGSAFEGKVSGNISYNILNGLVGVAMKGTSMNAEAAIAGASGIKNALSGKLNFKANVTTKGETDVMMMKNLKGNASFDISDGVFGNIGRFDNLLLAQNIMSNPVLKAGVNAIRTLPVIKNTANFKSLNGKLTFKDGWTELIPVKSAGPAMAYYITGKYNLLNGTANLVILGRISAEVVKMLGPLGDLSLSKLTSYIPGIGAATSRIVQAITTSPYGERVSEIPNLTLDNSNHKDFKVQFNGGIESTSSVKSFRWLSVCDTSEIESFKIKDQVEAAKNAMQEVKNKQIEAYNQQMAEQRRQAQESAQELKNAAEGLKNLFKSQTKTSAPVNSSTGETSQNSNVQSTSEALDSGTTQNNE